MNALSTFALRKDLKGSLDMHYSIIPKHLMLKLWYILKGIILKGIYLRVITLERCTQSGFLMKTYSKAHLDSF
jgi:hypothetical protein